MTLDVTFQPFAFPILARARRPHPIRAPGSALPLSPDLARFVLNHNRPDLFGTGFCTRDGHGYLPGTPRARSCARTRPTEIRSFFNLRTSTMRLLTKTLLARSEEHTSELQSLMR